MTALAIHDLVFGYGRTPAVRGVTLSVMPGDCYGFLGHNGAGKTTVMRLALGLLRPTRGSVHVFGVDALRAGRRARSVVGALIERPGFHLAATAHDNLRWLARLQGMPRVLAGAESRRVLEQAGLAAVGGRRVGTFSLGMRQRLGIAAALLGRPRLLLLDEPASSLDPEGIAELRALLLGLTRDEGVAVLLSSHQLAEIEGVCNRVGVLRDGAMVIEGSIEMLRRRLGMSHIVEGAPIAAMERRLVELGLQPNRVGERLHVVLATTAPGDVARALTQVGELRAFGPEPATLEAIYLHAASLPVPEARVTPAPDATGAPAASVVAVAPLASAGAPPRPAAELAAPPAARATAGAPAAPEFGTWRAFRHEWTTMVHRRGTAVLLLLPAVLAAWSVLRYRDQVERGLQRVRAGELFSADGGSGPLALALALQAAMPVLALVLLGLASQSIAGDLGADTLRNTVLRGVGRGEVFLGKLGALLVATLLGLALTVTVPLAAVAATLGFGDLEEISRHGDRQQLAALGDAAPVVWTAVAHCILPMAAVVALGLFASVLARRPARAIAVAVLLLLLPEVVRDRFPATAGWLLTSHLPAGWRDDSALGYAAAVARGAADAFWQFRAFALGAPALWFAAAGCLVSWLLRRLRIP